MSWFLLQDLKTGRTRDIVLEQGGTEKDARKYFGGIWMNAERVVCHGPCPLGPASCAGC